MSELEDLDCAEQGHRWLSFLCYILLIFFMMQSFARPNIIVPVKIWSIVLLGRTGTCISVTVGSQLGLLNDGGYLFLLSSIK